MIRTTFLRRQESSKGSVLIFWNDFVDRVGTSCVAGALAPAKDSAEHIMKWKAVTEAKTS